MILVIKTADIFLKNNDLTINNLSKKTGLSTSTLSNTFNRPLKTWKFVIFQSLAKATDTTPDRIVRELQPTSWKLNINDKKQTIQGYKIHNSKVFQKVEFTVMNERFEGWKPNYSDIKKLAFSYNHPSSLVRRLTKEYLNEAQHEK